MSSIIFSERESSADNSVLLYPALFKTIIIIVGSKYSLPMRHFSLEVVCG